MNANAEPLPTKVQTTIDGLAALGYTVRVEQTDSGMYDIRADINEDSWYAYGHAQVCMTATRFWGRYVRSMTQDRRCKTASDFWSWARIVARA